MVRTHGLTHVAVAVRDAERAFRFYEAVFGAVAVYRQDGFIQAQTPRNWDVLVFEEDAKRAGKAGGTIREQGEFCPGEPYLFCTDPDGYEVEIWYELPTPVDPPANDSASRTM